MNQDSMSLDQKLLSLLQSAKEAKDDSARDSLNALLRADPTAREAMARLLIDEQALVTRLRDDSILSLLDSAPVAGQLKTVPLPNWLTRRPLTAAAAGIVFGMLCTSILFGFASKREVGVGKASLAMIDPGLEGMKSLDEGLPHGAGEWGVRSAQIVTAENGVSPMQGQHMLRMESHLISEQDENQYSHACQVLDVRSLPMDAASGSREAQVTASFCAPKDSADACYVIRVLALNEPSDKATEDFWSKLDDAGVVSLKQKFESTPGDHGWHTFSVKMPLPSSAQSLVIMLSVVSPKNTTIPAPVRYLDDVQVSLLTSPALLP
jgi:hypothetical protein